MRTKDKVSDEKLRGGFYSPDVLVDLCLERAKTLLTGKSALRVLEPSAGDGAFLRGINRCGLAGDIAHVEAVELLGDEAAKAAYTLHALGLPGHVVEENVLRWNQESAPDYDLVLANPPYVRFQFISEEDKQLARGISTEMGIAGNSVSNLWIPVFLLSLSKLRVSGAFAVILPTEFLTGISASVVRNWLLENTQDLTIDLFKPGSFPSVLQEVLIISGHVGKKIRGATATVHFHDHNGGTHSWIHSIAPAPGTWTRYLLTPSQNSVLSSVSSIPEVQKLGSVARFSVSTVTGANGYFCVDTTTLQEYELSDWAVPMLPRSRNAKGLVIESDEHQVLVDSGLTAWMLNFSADRPSPENRKGAKRYLELGVDQGIDRRFKCRTRTPWYRVPVVPAGDLLLSKRSNRYPRVISNHAGVVTTDTIYKGQLLPGAPIIPNDFTATFHNSLTMLSAEVEGRSFGGGVLELVPSEVNSLLLPVIPGAAAKLAELDSICRTSSDPQTLVEATDEAVARLIPALDVSVIETLSEARHALMGRRLQRMHSKFYG